MCLQVFGQAVADIKEMFFAFYRRVFAKAVAPMPAEAAFKIGKYIVLIEQDKHIVAFRCVSDSGRPHEMAIPGNWAL